jgi:ribulose-phosphate 3-epimerase
VNLPIVAPSILASDFANLQKEITMINDSAADWIHVDIMDGVFVPNISMGLPVVHAVKKHARKPLDVHLMIVQPERYIEAFRQAGAEIISVHAEACIHLHRTIEQIKATGAKAGVALNPHTPVSVLSEIITDIDMVCMMSVNPGFGGQKFIANTYNKIQELSALIAKKNAKVDIEIDGGVNEDNAKPLIDAGATVLVAGNFVFASVDPKKTISKLKSIGNV